MQRKLRRLSHCPDEQQYADGGHERPTAESHVETLVRQFRRHSEHLSVIEGTEVREHQGNAEQESKISDPVDHECLQIGIDRTRPGVPETDQQIGHQPDRFPSEK